MRFITIFIPSHPFSLLSPPPLLPSRLPCPLLISQELGKKVLLVDFSSLYGKQTGESNLDADLRGLFRESLMSNAVLFFDECEVAFRSRSMGGGDRLLNSLLTEIERHEGIVFLATNRPHELVSREKERDE